jgi:hypothetical protein
MRSRLFLIAAAGLLFMPVAFASVLFDTGVGNNSQSGIAADSGLGQAVSVSQNVTLTQFGFYVSATSTAGDIRFLIFDSTNTNLLFSITEALPTGGPALLLSPSFTYNLTGGETYNFGFVSDTSFTQDLTFPATVISQNGFATVGGNDAYQDYADPSYLRSGPSTISLQLDGMPTAAVPEPGTTLPIGAILIGGLAVRHSLRRPSRSVARARARYHPPIY